MKLLNWLIGIVLAAWAGQYLMALAVPNLMMNVLFARGGEQVGYNSLYVAPLADADSRTVVRPSPDLFYAICIYDLEEGPVEIEAPVPARYWSMQFYQMNTSNYAGLTNQRDERHRVGGIARVRLIGPDGDPAAFGGTVIQSPTQRGVMLLRASAIGDREGQRRALEGSSCRRT